MNKLTRELLDHLKEPKISTAYINKLLKQGANANYQDKKIESPFLYSCENNNIDVVKLFLSVNSENEPDTKKLNSQGENCIHLLLKNHKLHPAEEKYSIIKDLIRRGADIKQKGINGKTTLHYAVDGNNSHKIIELLIKEGVEVNSFDNDNKPPIFYALQENGGIDNTEIVETLIDNCANVCLNNSQSDKVTYLHKACILGSVKVVKVLLNAGFKVNALDIEERSPLDYAFESGNNNIIKLLIKNGAKVKLKNDASKTNIHYAVLSNNKEIIQILLEKGFDINTLDEEGKTPLDLAVEEEKDLVINYLIKNGAKRSK